MARTDGGAVPVNEVLGAVERYLKLSITVFKKNGWLWTATV